MPASNLLALKHDVKLPRAGNPTCNIPQRCLTKVEIHSLVRSDWLARSSYHGIRHHEEHADEAGSSDYAQHGKLLVALTSEALSDIQYV